MYVNQMDLMVRKKRNKDLLRETEHERLAGAVRGSVSAGTGLLDVVAAWVRTSRVSADSSLYLPTLTPSRSMRGNPSS
jgi:hypothetical protein